MDVQQLMDAGPTAPLVSSRYFHDLREALEKVLDGASSFTHFMIVSGGSGSIRLFLQKPLEGAVNLPQGTSTASEVASELIVYTEEAARYSEKPSDDKVKGWSIRAVTIGPRKAAIAEAVWV